jgi:hypothetical protein
MSYGPHGPDLFRRAATYVDKVLKGARPADLPVEQPTKFDLIINLKTAKALGLIIAGVAAAPRAVSAQRAVRPTIGVLHLSPASSTGALRQAFSEGLREHGYV